MRFADGRRSLCVSSQSGCPLTCSFCATGTMKFGRNLTASEILDQALHFRRGGPVDHAVFMGMGEPLLNLDNVIEACERLPDIGITWRRTAPPPSVKRAASVSKGSSPSRATSRIKAASAPAGSKPSASTGRNS